jgi:hypothetical protein
MHPSYKHGQGNVRAQTSDELLKKTVEKTSFGFICL